MKSSENPLGSEPVSTLLRRFAVPSVIAMLVSALYNMVDQLFIGHSIGVLGNAATNVAFPLSMVLQGPPHNPGCRGTYSSAE